MTLKIIGTRIRRRDKNAFNNMGTMPMDRLEKEFMKSIGQSASIAFVTIDLTLGEEKN